MSAQCLFCSLVHTKSTSNLCVCARAGTGMYVHMHYRPGLTLSAFLKYNPPDFLRRSLSLSLELGSSRYPGVVNVTTDTALYLAEF